MSAGSASNRWVSGRHILDYAEAGPTDKVLCMWCKCVVQKRRMPAHQRTPRCRAARLRQRLLDSGASPIDTSIAEIIERAGIPVRVEKHPTEYHNSGWGDKAYTKDVTYTRDAAALKIAATIIDLMTAITLNTPEGGGKRAWLGLIGNDGADEVLADLVRTHLGPRPSDAGLAALAALDASHPEVAWDILTGAMPDEWTQARIARAAPAAQLRGCGPDETAPGQLSLTLDPEVKP